MDLNTSCEPMDIDLSSNSVSAMDVSYNEQFSTNNTIIKKEKKIDDETNKIVTPSTTFKKLEVDLKPKNLNLRNKYFLHIIGVTVLLLSGIIYQITSIKCNGNLNTDLIRYKFSNRIYGQAYATDKIVKSLEINHKNKMLILYGRSGVGKTLSVSLILEDLLSYSNVYHYTMPTLVDMFTADLLLGLTLCGNSIFVVDDIKSNDTAQVKEIVQALVTKSKSLNKNLTVILIYNCGALDKQFSTVCESTFHSDLNISFNDVDIYKEFIEFNPLDESTLRKCIEYELGDKKVSVDILKKIFKNFNVSHDGCKGVHQKMKYLNII